MPTPKQVRRCYKRVRYHIYQLQTALNEAHNLNVIKYDDYATQAPCRALGDVRDRFDASTEKQRAQAIKDELMKELKGVY